MKDQDLAASIKSAARNCGFEACGIIRTGEIAEYAAAVAARVKQFPESSALYARMAEPDPAFAWAKSVIVCTRWYGKYRIPAHLEGVVAKSFCVNPRKDPHSQEYQDRARFVAALDNLGLRHSGGEVGKTPVRWAAVKAGIGVIRKNNFFYTEQGSWCILDAYLIDRELELKARPVAKECPEQCDLCLRACPTGALSAPFQTNGVACIAYLLGYGECGPDKPLYDKCGGWIFGCDACQDACPCNKGAWSGNDAYPGLEEFAEHISYERILDMDYETMRGLFSQKLTYLQSDTVWKLKCNVLNAMRNAYEEKYLPHIRRALRDPQPEVRAMAAWVLEKVTEAL